MSQRSDDPRFGALVNILRERSVRFGEFTLKSGARSDLYVDARLTTLHSDGSRLIAELILETLAPDVVGVGGPSTGADPIAGSVATMASLRGVPIHGFMVRKEPKGHGRKLYVEGRENFVDGAKVCLVEDTITTGGSLLEAIERVEDSGLVVAQVIVVVDREEGGEERVVARGYPFHALVRRRDLLQAT